MRVLWTDARVLGPDAADTGLRAMAIDGPWILWAGRDPIHAPRCDRRRSLGRRFISPGFIDCHVHLTATGLTLAGVDLHGARSAGDVRRAVARHTARDRGRFVWGTGWDDAKQGWRGSGPTGVDLDAVAGDRFIYVTRVDSHSAVVSSRLFDAAGCARFEGADRAHDRFTGVVRRDAHHAARRYVLDHLPESRLASAQRTAGREAARAGIVAVHEMSGPHVAGGERDLDVLLGQRDRLPVEVLAYYASEDLQVPLDRGLRTVGGDLNVDGSLGSRTAALHRSYADAKGHTGSLYRDAGDCAAFFEAATRAGLQAGVHCIGEAACEAAVIGLDRAARRTSLAAVRRCRHRLEHFEMASPELIARAARLGAGISMQPAFDAAWGGGGGMYAARVGERRARSMNDVRRVLRDGCVCGFGSDSPITPFDPLGGVAAAVAPSAAIHAVPFTDAFRCATLGGSALARDPSRGRIAAGYRADFVVWDGRPGSRRAAVAATVCGGRVVAGAL